MSDVIRLFATGANLPRDPSDCSFRTLGEVFESLEYQINNGENVLHELRSLAKLTANYPVPVSILEYDGEDDDEPAQDPS